MVLLIVHPCQRNGNINMIRIVFLFFLILTLSNCQPFDFSKLSCREVEDTFGNLSVEVFSNPHCNEDSDCQLLGSKGGCQCLHRIFTVRTVLAFPKSFPEFQALHDRFFSDACSHQRACAYNRSVGPMGYLATCNKGYCRAIPIDEDLCR